MLYFSASRPRARAQRAYAHILDIIEHMRTSIFCLAHELARFIRNNMFNFSYHLIGIFFSSSYVYAQKFGSDLWCPNSSYSRAFGCTSILCILLHISGYCIHSSSYYIIYARIIHEYFIKHSCCF